MSDILSAIQDDIDEYKGLCELYRETVEYSDGSPDCYGDHCKELLTRRDLAHKRWVDPDTLERISRRSRKR
jgi:hypothetical protein